MFEDKCSLDRLHIDYFPFEDLSFGEVDPHLSFKLIVLDNTPAIYYFWIGVFVIEFQRP